MVKAPGHGWNPRSRFHVSIALRSQSMRPSSFFRIGASVACASFCGVGVSVPASSRCSVSMSNAAPSSARRGLKVTAVSDARIGAAACSSTSPVSRPASMRIVVTPVVVSPFAIAHWIGAAPRYFGSSEACRLRLPSGGRSIIHCGMMRP
jgi:hypothetical protein